MADGVKVVTAAGRECRPGGFVLLEANVACGLVAVRPLDSPPGMCVSRARGPATPATCWFWLTWARQPIKGGGCGQALPECCGFVGVSPILVFRLWRTLLI